MSVPQNVLIEYNMVGQLLTPPYESVYWTVYNTPDSTGASSGYFGKLQNIRISSSFDISSPTSGIVIPTSPATGDLSGNYPNPIVVGLDGIPFNLNVPPHDGWVLTYSVSLNKFQWQAPSNNFTPTPTTITGNFNVPLGNNSLILVGTISAPISVSLPLAPLDGQLVLIKDAKGSAHANPISIFAFVPDSNTVTIDGSFHPFILSQNYQSVQLIFNLALNQWAAI